MNYNNIPAGPEMDNLIAERVMGWKPEGGGWFVTHIVNGFHGHRFTNGNPSDYGEDGFYPSSSIAHAMEAVAAMRSHKNNWFTLSWYGDCDEWHAGQGDGTMAWPGIGATAPLAICRALLMAVK
jgi:hypothetical protein